MVGFGGAVFGGVNKNALGHDSKESKTQPGTASISSIKRWASKHHARSICALAYSVLLALDKVVPARTGMRNQTLVLTATSEYHPIGSWTASSVDMVAFQNRELVVWAGIGELESFVIIVLMRVSTRATTPRSVGTSLVQGVIDVRLIVADCTAGIHARGLGKPLISVDGALPTKHSLV